MNTHNPPRRISRILTVSLWLLAASPFSVCGDPLPLAAPADVGLSADRLARVDGALQRYVNEQKLAGAVVLVARHGRVAHLSAIGNAGNEPQVPMRSDSLFRIFSMTKPITSVALLMLYEQGAFQLSDPAQMYIPAFRSLKVAREFDDAGQPVLEDPVRPMSVHDLFRHTSGLGYGFGNSPLDALYRKAGIGDLKIIGLDPLIERLGKLPLGYQPGTRWEYSYAHDVQAWLVQKLSGQSFDRYLKERIFAPLGMEDTSFGLARQKLGRLTTMYGPAGYDNELVTFAPLPSGIEAIETPRHSEYLRMGKLPAGGTGIVTSAADYFRFSQMLLNGGEYNGVRLLSRKTVELMTSNHLPPGMGGLLSPGSGYGLGVSVLLDPVAAGNLGSVGQFGWGGAASTYVMIDPVEDMVSILMVQYRPTSVRLWQEFQTLVYQAVAD